MSRYDQLVLRNEGYVDRELQERVRACRLLVAGCGVGSSFAEAAVRLGFCELTLIDGDTVAPHNLNRQDFVAADIGRNKALALADRLRAINPEARIQAVDGWLTGENATELVAGADLVFDTIDFLSLGAITALHDACRELGRPAISAFSAGWGAGAMFFPPHGQAGFRQIFGLPASGPVEDSGYVQHFAVVLEALRGRLPSDVLRAVSKALTVMEDGQPCPAPHVSVGAAAVAGLALTVALRVLRGDEVQPAPQLLLMDFGQVCVDGGVCLAEEVVRG